MRRLKRLIAASVLVALSGALVGCSSNISSFDPMDWLDWIDTKKKLQGDRKPVFPDGVPGLEQGVPKSLYKGAQQEPDLNAQEAAVPPPPPAETKSKKTAKKSKQQPAAATASHGSRGARRRQHGCSTTSAQEENRSPAHHGAAARSGRAAIRRNAGATRANGPTIRLGIPRTATGRYIYALRLDAGIFRRVPTFRSSCSLAAPAFTNFGKLWATHKLIDSEYRLSI